MSGPRLIAMDWGTSNARAALLDADGSVLEEQSGHSGVGELGAIGFALRFGELTNDWPKLPAIACGMIGSRQGWREAEYLDCPLNVGDIAENLTVFEHEGEKVAIVPGLKLDDGWRYDVMRGEETQLAGFLAQCPDFSGTVIMPGTHSKCVAIRSGKVTTFQTYMTGDLFAAISDHTILRHTVSEAGDTDTGFASVAAAIAGEDRPIDGRLFGLRAKALLGGSDEASLRQELSALLIHSELRAAVDDGYVLDDHTVLIGAPPLTARYVALLKAQQIIAEQIEGTGLVWPALFDLAAKADLMETLT